MQLLPIENDTSTSGVYPLRIDCVSVAHDEIITQDIVSVICCGLVDNVKQAVSLGEREEEEGEGERVVAGSCR